MIVTPPPMQSKETTIESMNEAIAIFDGYEFIKGDPDHKCNFCFAGDEPCTPAVDRFVKDGRVVPYYELKYHTSWDWLMPVVEKIRGLGYHIEITLSVDCSVDIIKLRGDPQNDVLHIVAYSSPINAVHTACHQFIQWLNKNKPNAE